MNRYVIRVTESINHDYVVDANNEDEALTIYNSYDNQQLKDFDADGQSSWDRPWEVLCDGELNEHGNIRG